MSLDLSQKHRVVIVGGGFGGLYAAKRLESSALDVTLVDKRNFHLFQPLLYQVASGGLSPGDIASPLRSVLKKQKNLRVVLSEACGFDPAGKRLITRDGDLRYDTLIVAAGASNSYFGHDDWSRHAPGLKTIEDALTIRSRILSAFERAEIETDDEKRRALLTFAVVGGGPTGVEMAGAIAEIATKTLRNEFRSIRATDARVLLIEGSSGILDGFVEPLQKCAKKSLEALGVELVLEAYVTGIDESGVTIERSGEGQRVESATVLWAAGVRANPLSEKLAKACHLQTDHSGKIETTEHLTLAGHDDIFLIGDMASFKHQTGKPLPGIAPVAMSQGRYVAQLILGRLEGKDTSPYHYADKGILATIGRAAAVAQFRGGKIRFSGLLAWLVWLFVHLMYLVEFDNRILVLTQWTWNYFTQNRGARIITNSDDLTP